MKKDYRVKIPYDLRKPFGDYRSNGELLQYFQLYSSDDKSLDSVLPNLVNSSGMPCVGSQINLLRDTPFTKLAKYSSNLEATDESYYRIQYGNQINKPFVNDDNPFSISFWIRLPSLGVTSPDNESVVFNKIEAGKPSSSWESNGEMALTYMSSTRTFLFQLAGTSDLSNPGTFSSVVLSFSTVAIDTLKNVKFRDGEWIHITVVKKQGESFDNGGTFLLRQDPTGTYVDSWIKIYVNGSDATNTTAGSITGYNAGTASGPAVAKFKPNKFQGDITLGRGKGDATSQPAVNNTACGLYDFAVWRKVLTNSEINEIWSRSQYSKSSGFLTVSPRVQARKQINSEISYLPVKNTPKVSLSNKPFDESKYTIFKPTTIPLEQIYITDIKPALPTKIFLSKNSRISYERPAKIKIESAVGFTTLNEKTYFARPRQITKTISSITKANPGVITTAGVHEIEDGQKVQISNNDGMFELNNKSYFADVISTTTFALYQDEALTLPLDTSSFQTYVSNSGKMTANELKTVQLYEDYNATLPLDTSGTNITGATTANPCVVTTAVNHGFVDKTKIEISSVGGMTNLNGNQYYVKVVSETTFSIYTDYSLSAAVDAIAFPSYTSGGSLKQVWISNGLITITRPLQNLQYPINLPYDNGGDLYRTDLTGSLLSSPNEMPNIIAPGIESFSIIQNYYDETSLSEKQAVNNPFNDSLVLPNGAGKFYGATKSIAGFSRKVRDKTQIILELPLNEDADITRYSAQWDLNNVKNYDGTTALNPHSGSGGRFEGKEKTGFLYYNKSRGVWEQKGLFEEVRDRKGSKSATAVINLTGGQPQNGENFTIEDSVGTSYKLSMDTSTSIAYATPGPPFVMNIGAQFGGGQPFTLDRLQQRILDAINSGLANPTFMGSNTVLRITAKPVVTTDGTYQIVLTQTDVGPAGNKAITAGGVTGLTIPSFFSGGITGLYTLEETAQKLKLQKFDFIDQSTQQYSHTSSAVFSSGSSHIMRMFHPGGATDGQGQYFGQTSTISGELANADISLAKNIGYPTLSNSAPNATQYFATSSQTIKMSDYISEPFILEKVVLEIPEVEATKTFDYPGEYDSDGSSRPQDDYVFFLMRQWRRVTAQESSWVDTSFSDKKFESIISSSMRYIICSGSACFYNNKRRLPGNSPASGYAEWSPHNTPAFSHDFNKDIEIAQDVLEMKYNGLMQLPMVPAVASKKSLGNYFVPGWDGHRGLYITQSDYSRLLITTSSNGEPGLLQPGRVNSFWPGGTSTTPLFTSLTGSREDLSKSSLKLASYKTNSPQYYGKNINNPSMVDERTFFELDFKNPGPGQQSRYQFIDPRSFKTFGAGATEELLPTSTGISGSWAAGYPDNLQESNAESPYLLFPEDELILGVDAALGLTARMAAGVTADAVDKDGNKIADQSKYHKYIRGANNLTGSVLSIRSGQPMILRLYGSLVKDQIQAPDYPKLDISQPEITDTIVGNHVLDQYDVSLKVENSGSYRERLLTGSLTTVDESGTRRPTTGVGIFSTATGTPFQLRAAENSNDYANSLAGGGTRIFTPDNSTVITASIPSGITGFTYGTGHPLAGQPLEKIYIRFYYDGESGDIGWRAKMKASGGSSFWYTAFGWPTGFGSGVLRQWPDTRKTGEVNPDEWIIKLGGLKNASASPGWENSTTSEDSFTSQISLSFTNDDYYGTRVIKGLDVGGQTYSPYSLPMSGLEVVDAGNGSVRINVTGNPQLGNQITFTEGRVQDGLDNFYVTGSTPKTVSSISQASPALVTVSTTSNIAYGQQVNFSVNISSGDASVFDSKIFAKPVTPTTFELYQDNGLDTAVDTTSIVFTGVQTYTIEGVETPSIKINQSISGSAYSVIPNGFSGLQGGLVTINAIREVAATTNKGNMGEYGTFQRFSRHTNKQETYYDSAVPMLLDVWKCLGRVPSSLDVLDFTTAGTPAGTPQLELLLYGITAGEKYLGTGAGGSSPGGMPSIDVPGGAFSSDWWGAFPFEPKFLEVPPPEDLESDVEPEKVQRIFGESAVTDNEGRVAASLYWISNDTYPGWGQSYQSISKKGAASGSLGFDWQDLLNGPNNDIGKTSSTNGNAQVGLIISMENQTFGLDPSYLDLAKSSLKVFYGIGDGPGGLINNSPEDYLYPTSDSYSGQDGLADSNGKYPNYFKIFRRSKKPRGWKYGLINALPQSMTAVFRADSFGQFRDMLEGRPYAVVKEAGSAEENNYNTAPVEVKFVQPTWSTPNPKVLQPVPPIETRSGNLSFFATSSFPYFDSWGVYGDYPFGRDRPEEISTNEIELVFADESD